MRKNALNVAIFLFLAGGLFFLYQQADKWIPKPPLKEEKAAKSDDQKKDGPAKKEDGKQPEPPKAEPKQPVVGPPAPPREPIKPTLVRLGGEGFYNDVLLTTLGGGVQQVVLPEFGQADRLGRPVKDAAGKRVPLYLVPGVQRHRGKALHDEFQVPDLRPGKVADPSALAEPSYLLFHYPTTDDKYPDPLLGEEEWAAAEGYRDEKGAPKPQVLPGDVHQMVFEYELKEHPVTKVPYYVKFRKTYTLGPKDYHVGLRIEITRLPGGQKGAAQLRYQIAGPHGLPIEGEWYSTTYRNAIVGWVDEKGTPRRQIEDAASIGAKRGGEKVPLLPKHQFKYMVVATQYFASGVAVDDAAEGAEKNPWSYVRATTELPFGVQQNVNTPYFDDITVRAASEVIDLAPGEPPASHAYLLYNGPSKVRLLKLMSGERGAVDPPLVDYYMTGLTLSTITDYRSDTKLGWFLEKIWWSDLVIACTNLMHWLLAEIHSAIWHWALSIVVLTGIVRMILLYPSRRQTAMSMKMMEVQKRLQPEFEKLQEKYKDDMHAYNREKTRLMMQHGVNPFAAMGGCLLLLAQMPVMMGLYFCLQESIFFRLEPFLWINNMAAPDMLYWWGEKIPFVSTPEDLGSFIYLGPYFNLLPLLAVGLMLYQQAKMMPPSTDPQAESQRKMMKFMMVMMAFFFYKVAAGLALYFIVSTTWGILERQFIPKPKIDLDQAGSGPGAAASANGKPAAPKEPTTRLGRWWANVKKNIEEIRKRADEQARRQIRNDPNRPGGDEGNNPNQNDQGNNRRDRDRRKRRRK